MPDADELRARLNSLKKPKSAEEKTPEPSFNGNSRTHSEIRWEDDPVVKEKGWDKPDRCANCGEVNTRMQAVVDALIEQAVDEFANKAAGYIRNRTARTLSPAMAADMVIAERARQRINPSRGAE